MANEDTEIAFELLQRSGYMVDLAIPHGRDLTEAELRRLREATGMIERGHLGAAMDLRDEVLGPERKPTNPGPGVLGDFNS